MGKWSQYQQRYCINWEREECLKSWIRRVPGDEQHVFCSYCRCEIRAHHSDLIAHMKSAKHRRNSPRETKYHTEADDPVDLQHNHNHNIIVSLPTTSSPGRSQHQIHRVKTYDVFAGNLPKEVDEKMLNRMFSKFGTIHATWCNNSDTGSRFGFVRFYDEPDALRAAAEINGTFIEGRKLVTRMATKSEPTIKKEIDVKPYGEKMNLTSVTESKFVTTSSHKLASNVSKQNNGTPSRSQDNGLTTLIKKLQILSRTVKKLRQPIPSLSTSLEERILVCICSCIRLQFPLDKDSPIDAAIASVLSPCKIDMNSFSSLGDTSACLSTYMMIQNEILNCPNKTNLQSQIEARESVKSQLLFKLGKSINEMNSVSLHDRQNQLQEEISLLRKHYEGFLTPTVTVSQHMETLFASFVAWKAKHTEEVNNARNCSDELEKSVNVTLETLKSSISINSEGMDEEFEDDLIGLLKKYISALELEVSKIKPENSSDFTLIASVVHVVMEKLKEELTSVDSLCKTQQQFKTLYNDIKTWLKKTPSLAPLQSLRSQLKTLKSKLRHKLADKADAEENQEMVDVVLIIKELEDMRSIIQKTLLEEDMFLANHSELLTTHFPELINEEFAEDFKTFLTYKGLVKLSHSPDLYTLVSMNNTSWFTAQFNGEPMLIKEYFLGNTNKLNKAGFLSQLSMFVTALSPYIEPVQAIFFDKDSRHAYLSIRKHGVLLFDKIHTQPLFKQHCQSIVKDLSKALQTLHQSNLTHGQLNPDFVLVDDNGAASLLPPDFSMNLSERIKCKYVTTSKLEFISPEMKQNKKIEPFPAQDVYSLGLIALWLNYPNVEFPEGLGGTVNISSISWDHNLHAFLKAVLNPNPLLRPTVESCLKNKYLTFPILS